MVQSCMTLLEAQVTAHGGRTVKTLGDGMLCAFPAAIATAAAARAMAEATATHALAVRIAAHWGVVLEDAGDIFGDAVNTLARIAGLATPSEILLSRALFEVLPDVGAWKARPLPPVPVKGKREPLELVALLRPTVGRPLLKSTVSGGALGALVSQGIALCFGATEVIVDADHAADLGRDPASTLVIDSAYASRMHARVFVEGGLLLLQDRSSNGTWVVPDGQSPVQIVRRQTPLMGCGRIYFGADPRTTLTKPVIYKTAGEVG